jgi:hypothetical protein
LPRSRQSRSVNYVGIGVGRFGQQTAGFRWNMAARIRDAQGARFRNVRYAALGE